jgi:hypothetical protein
MDGYRLLFYSLSQMCHPRVSYCIVKTIIQIMGNIHYLADEHLSNPLTYMGNSHRSTTFI